MLIVDDDPEVLAVLSELLRDTGFRVVPATNADDALKKAVRTVPDVLITDLDLGKGLSGIELGAVLRRRWPTLPVVYISGRNWLMRDYVFDDCEVFLAKPFRQHELVDAIHAVRHGKKVAVMA
jgi:DNA-binding response OmpR family regulator